jgi:hypothetical protein
MPLPKKRAAIMAALKAAPGGLTYREIAAALNCTTMSAISAFRKWRDGCGVTIPRAPDGGAWRYFSSQERADAFTGHAPLIARARPSPRMDAIVQLLEAHPEGITVKTVREAFRILEKSASKCLMESFKEPQQAMVRVRDGYAWRYFRCPEKLKAWKRAQSDNAAALAQALAVAKVVQPTYVQAEPEKRSHKIKYSPDMPRTPPPPYGRVDVMADALPGVPGWMRGPVIRPGAMDYRQHQERAKCNP